MRILLVSFLIVFSLITNAFTGEHHGHVDSDDKDLVMTNYFNKVAGLFDEESIVGEPAMVACQLASGIETSCLSVTLPVEPRNIAMGPWCPRTISDGPDKSGIWLEAGQVHDADGKFIENLASFYEDEQWQMYDAETGVINVTDTKVACEAAARPDVDPQYMNFCVECQTAYMEEGLTTTYLIPLEAIEKTRQDTRVGRDGVGVAFSGVRIDASAPTDDILGAHTLAPFDDCGGHVNLNVGYHLHAITDCLKEVDSIDNHAPSIGIAMDGVLLYTEFNADGSKPDDLDQCGGHSYESLGYHYHVADPGKNKILACHTREAGCVVDSADSTKCEAKSRPPRPTS